MFDQPGIYDSLKRLNWNKAKSRIDASDIEAPDLADLVLKQVTQSGCLILRHGSDAKREKRDALFEGLKRWFGRNGTADQIAALMKHAKEAQIIEGLFREIFSVMQTSEIQKLAPQTQAWAVIDRVLKEHEILMARLLGLKPDMGSGLVLLDAVSPKVADDTGVELSIDSVLEGLVSFVSNTLQMLILIHGWEDQMFPPRVDTSEDELYKAGTHQYLSTMWGAVIDASEHLRFNDEDLEVIPQKARSGGSACIAVFGLDLKLDLLLQVARVRHHQLQLQITSESVVRLSDSEFKDPRHSPVALPPDEFISRAESVTIWLLDTQYHMNIQSDEKLAGLTLREWVRCYATLQSFVETDANGLPKSILVEVAENDLNSALKRAGVRPESVPLFLEAARFRHGSRDIYDCPLVKTSDGKIYMFNPFLASGNLLDIVLSQLSTQGVNSAGKGDSFELAVLRSLERAGILARRFEWTDEENQHYQCDAAFILDDYLFVFECKNYLLPNNSPAEEFHFLTDVMEAGAQAARISAALEMDPSVAEKYLGPNAKYKEVITIVLNAMSFSVPGKVDGVYYCDFSSLSRFCENPDIYFSHSFDRKGQPKIIKFRVARLWKGERPTAKDLLNQLENPVGLRAEVGLWSVKRSAASISKDWAVGRPILKRKPQSIASFLKIHGWSRRKIRQFEEALVRISEKLSS